MSLRRRKDRIKKINKNKRKDKITFFTGLSSMEERVKRFYELHNNKWFHLFNLTLDYIKMTDPHEKYMLKKYGLVFYS